jgi:diaminopimelate decarboxylase
MGTGTTIFGRSAQAWGEAYGLPLHITALPQVRDNLRAFAQVFRDLYPRGSIRYAVKASGHPALLKAVREEGAGADVDSPFEARSSLMAGMEPRALTVNGNGKDDDLIREAVAQDMLLVADSAEELAQLDAAARIQGRRARTLLRLSGFELGALTGASILTSGTWSKFGIAQAEAPDLLEALPSYPSLRCLGLHAHLGSQITRPEPYLAVLGRMLELSRILEARTGHCSFLDLGGGFPVNYLDLPAWNTLRRRLAARDGFGWNQATGGLRPRADGTLDEADWQGTVFHCPWPKAEMLRAILQGEVRVEGRTQSVLGALEALGGPELLVEPGRSIVEDAGITFCKVAQVRRAAAVHNLVTVELGVMSHADALLGGAANRWELVGGEAEPEPFETFIAGNLCFSGDLLTPFKTSLHRRPHRGETLIIRDTGAYSAQFMASNANAFPRPPRLLAEGDGRITVMKRRDCFEDIYEP